MSVVCFAHHPYFGCAFLVEDGFSHISLMIKNSGMQPPPCPIAEFRVGEIPLVEYTRVFCSIRPLIWRFANFIILSHIIIS